MNLRTAYARIHELTFLVIPHLNSHHYPILLITKTNPASNQRECGATCGTQLTIEFDHLS